MAPPLKVTWTHKFPWRLIHGTPEFKILITGGVLYICEDYYWANLTALDAETGKLLGSREFLSQLIWNILMGLHASSVKR